MLTAYLLYTGVFLWHSTCLLIGQLLSSTNFDSTILLFFIGIPIVIIIILTIKEDKILLLNQSINNLKTGEEVIEQIRYFLQLVDQREKDRESSVLLKGYILQHCEACTDVECYLLKYKKELDKSNDFIQLLNQHANYMFKQGISKFPHSTPLRMKYAFFLIERMHNKHQSLIELKNAEKYNPAFD